MKFKLLNEAHVEKWMIDLIRDYFELGDIFDGRADIYFTDEDGDLEDDLVRMKKAGVIYLDDGKFSGTSPTWHVIEDVIDSTPELRRLSDNYVRHGGR